MVTDVRFDFRGGLSTNFSQDALDISEVREAFNCRLGDQYGTLAKRAGTQRIHTNAIGGGGKVLGVTQWNSPSGAQVVAICDNGKLYHKLHAASDFTELATVTFSTTARPTFAVFIDSSAYKLYIGDGTQYAVFTGSAVSLVTTGSPPDPVMLAPFRSRMYCIEDDHLLRGSDIRDAEEWGTVAPLTGFADPVETYNQDPLVALAPVGAALALFKEDSIARLLGVSTTDVRVDEEVFGIDADIGCIARNSIVRVGSTLFFLSDRGPHICNMENAQPIGLKVEDRFDLWDRDAIANAVSVYNPARREVLIMGPSDGSSENDIGYVWNTRLGSWTGPWEFTGFNVCSACRYERSDGSESILLGGYDGFIREGDVASVGAKDDVLKAGTGGTAITMRVELPELLFGDPSAMKHCHYPQTIRADLGTGGVLKVTTSSDAGPTKTHNLPSDGSGPKPYDFRPAWRGYTNKLVIEESTLELAKLHGLTLQAEYGRAYV